MKKILLLFIVFISTNLFAQNWLRVDSVFAVSGVTVKSFSAPEFADLNNDGNIDLIIGNLNYVADFFWSNSNQFPSTYTNDATVLQSIYKPGQTHTNAAYPTLIDLDGDGVLDLVIGGYNGLRYYKNIGTISSPDFVSVDTVFTDVNTLIGTDPQPAFVDIDGDGDLDLYVGIGESLLGGPDAGITMGFRNTGTAANPQFTFDNTLVVGIPDIGLNSYPTFADLDNDGDYDLLFGRDLQTFVYFKNTGTNQNPIWTQNSTTFNGVETTTYWKNPDLVDIDYDGDFDLVYGTTDGIMYLYRNIGTASSPSFQYYPDYFKIIKLRGSGGSVSLADFDGDGDNDLLSGMWDGKFYYFRNDGTSEKPSFNLITTTPFSNFTVTSYSAPVFVDIDNDGDYDIVSGADNGQVFLYVNNNGTFTQNTTMFSSIDVGYRSRPTFADIDNDGDLDLLVGAETSGSTVFYTNDGNNVFTLNTTVFSSIAFPSYTTPTLADIDNDGDYDLTNGSLWGTVTYYRNDGTATTPVWVRADSMFTGIEVDQSSHTAFADFDGDGRKDMILAEYNGNFTFYKNLFSPITDVENEKVTTLPDDYVLYQNYPNPFNPTTSIQYTISSKQFVTLEIYDILGREVSTLINEEKPAGSYEVRFDANGLSSGVYFYSLKVNGVTYSKSMILLK
ncbi:MAG: FG-GAP-like repeat-containing protein [Ignavibacteriota bacterium]